MSVENLIRSGTRITELLVIGPTALLAVYGEVQRCVSSLLDGFGVRAANSSEMLYLSAVARLYLPNGEGVEGLSAFYPLLLMLNHNLCSDYAIIATEDSWRGVF